MRDRQLDIYRAIVMIYMVCIVHCCYLLGDAGEPILSILLFAMPSVFFISGASLSVSKTDRGIWATVKSRFKRVVAPYYIYALVLILTGIISTLILNFVGLSRHAFFDITQYDWEDCLNVLLAKYIPQFSFIWHLWFIPPYLILSCTFPLQVKLMKKTNRTVYLAASLALFLIVQAMPDLMLLKQVLCFNIFMVAGYLFYKQVKTSTLALTGAVSLAILVAYMFLLGGNFCPMQDHKFPPDWVYVVYNLLAISALSLVLGNITLKYNQVFKIWNERGYNIYLYQSVVYTIVNILRQKMPFDLPLPGLRLLLDASIVFLLSTALSYLTYPLERWVMKKLKL